MAFLVCLSGAAAWWAFPSWDDGVLWLNALEGGAKAVANSQPDRPIMGAIWGLLAAHGLLWIVAAAVYLITWMGTGVITLALWRRFFPEWAHFAIVAAILAISPVLLETQTIAVNPVFSGHFGAMLVYASQWLIWRPRHGRVAWGRIMAGGTLVFLASLISEYATLAAAVACGAFYGLSTRGSRLPLPARLLRQQRLLLAFTVACGVGGYLIYHLLGSADARPEIRPEKQLVVLGFRHLLEVPIRLPFSLWTALLGEFLKDLGEANFSRNTLWGIPVGLSLAAVVVGRLRRASSGEHADDALPPTPAWKRAMLLLVPLAVGLCAILAMSTTIRGNVASRYWQPLIPLTACLSLFILLTIVRSRFHVAVAALCAFTGAYLEGNAVYSARATARQAAAIGEKIHRELAPAGLTVALFVDPPTNHAVGDPPPRPYELISHLTRGWPAADRERFWAGAFSWQPIHQSVPGLGGACGRVTSINSDTQRGWKRQGIVSKVLWVSFDADGLPYIETGAGL